MKDEIEADGHYLSEALDMMDYGLFMERLGIVIRRRGIGEIAKASGITRNGIYRAISPNSTPRLINVLKLVKALGLRFNIKMGATNEVRVIDTTEDCV